MTIITYFFSIASQSPKKFILIFIKKPLILITPNNANTNYIRKKSFYVQINKLVILKSKQKKRKQLAVTKKSVSNPTYKKIQHMRFEKQVHKKKLIYNLKFYRLKNKYYSISLKLLKKEFDSIEFLKRLIRISG
ncbi:hypothetical protein TTHERM_00075690 (macronuclear) [Tetrahymena thermophila SB210]|uniref:Uncharacterized protein n=1 Tax=Tetrahymena thermophila (strain SB210) TaxID=312017 RepID=Q23G96_TETTS|nr:hypothetical protein TTHERM_00075690 [Tetrahymena thermophila SB210]EAR95364.2 hypothetical protein TTHERM_00075690 [Tetrahymena thermophila SB210]|eukprot:XP_001015609.2 hypothetical protein TTHERM_00075690 [Tetrahymena thermophila SB210]